MDRPPELEFAWLMFVGILLMFLLSMAVVIFFVYYQRKLYKQQTAMELLKLEEQKKRLQTEIAARENERARIAHDLHDEVGALLSTTKLYLTVKQPNSEITEQARETAAELLDEAVLKLRSIAQNLLPENLKLFGLVKAIEHSCRQMENAGVFSIDFQHNVGHRLPTESEMHLYRIVQELLNNAIKHAKASRVVLSLFQQPDDLILTYEDNGVGFAVEETKKTGSLGLTTLDSRVQMLQGEMLIKSTQGKGVNITITFPSLITPT